MAAYNYLNSPPSFTGHYYVIYGVNYNIIAFAIEVGGEKEICSVL